MFNHVHWLKRSNPKQFVSINVKNEKNVNNRGAEAALIIVIFVVILHLRVENKEIVGYFVRK